MKINRNVSWLKKDNSFAVYYNFGFIFLSDQSAKWFEGILSSQKEIIAEIPDDFTEFLKKRQIIS